MRRPENIALFQIICIASALPTFILPNPANCSPQMNTPKPQMNTPNPQKRQSINVSDFKNDTTLLQDTATKKVGKSVILDEKETAVSDFDGLSSDNVPAILVQENGGGGVVQIHEKSAELVDKLLTGPSQPQNTWLMFITDGQNFRFLGHPTIRYFRFH